MIAAGYAVAFILLTSNISAIYDGIDDDVFSVSFCFASNAIFFITYDI